MSFKEFVQSKVFSKIIIFIGALLVALIIFQAGIVVGYHNAAFSVNIDAAYGGNVRDPRSIFAPFGRDADDMNPHGAVGEIISVKLPQFMVKGASGNEEVILVGSTTSIRELRAEASTSELRVGEQTVTIGAPDDQGIIHATFVRIIPSPPTVRANLVNPANPTNTDNATSNININK